MGGTYGLKRIDYNYRNTEYNNLQFNMHFDGDRNNPKRDDCRHVIFVRLNYIIAVNKCNALQYNILDLSLPQCRVKQSP